MCWSGRLLEQADLLLDVGNLLLQELLLLLNDERGRGAGGWLSVHLLLNKCYLLLKEGLLLLDLHLRLRLQWAGLPPRSPLPRCPVDDAQCMSLSQSIHLSLLAKNLDGIQRV